MVVRVELRDSVALVLGVWEWGEGPSHFNFLHCVRGASGC